MDLEKICTLCGQSCSFSEENPNKFDRSQWCPRGRVSGWYLAYRILIALVLIAGISTQIYVSKLGLRWMIFMTNQGIVLLAVYFAVDAILVTVRFIHEKRKSEPYHKCPDKLPVVYKISWALGDMAFTIALWITVVYWSALHKYVVKYKLLTSVLAEVLNVFLHAFNSVTCLVDVFVCDRPTRAMHFVWPMLFGIYYASFSIVYWLAEGVGYCHKNKTVSSLPANEDGLYCDPYIYPILDWGDHTKLAVAVVSVGGVTIPLIHMVWYGLTKLRLYLACKCRGPDAGEQPENHPLFSCHVS